MKLNDRIALAVTSAVGTMACTYLFVLLSLSWFLVPQLATWVSQNFIQLVLLPLLMVGQKVQADRLDELHNDVRRHHALFRRHIGADAGHQGAGGGGSSAGGPGGSNSPA